MDRQVVERFYEHVSFPLGLLPSYIYVHAILKSRGAYNTQNLLWNSKIIQSSLDTPRTRQLNNLYVRVRQLQKPSHIPCVALDTAYFLVLVRSSEPFELENSARFYWNFEDRPQSQSGTRHLHSA